MKHKYQDGFAGKLQALLLWIYAGVFLFFTYISTHILLDKIPINEIGLLLIGVILTVLFRKKNLEYILYGAIICTIPLCFRYLYSGYEYLYYERMGWLEIWANCVLLFGSAITIWVGLAEKKKNIFMQGIVAMLILVFARYTDLVGDYITTALLFIGSGIGLLAVNHLWNKKYA